MHVLILLAAFQTFPPVPNGWIQVPYEANYGPEGAYHDAMSGAWVQYCTCPSPDAKDRGVPEWALRKAGAVREGSVGPMQYAEFSGKTLTEGFTFAIAYYASDGGFRAFLAVHARTAAQSTRARQLLLNGAAVWERPYPDYKLPDADTTESDLEALPLGSDLSTMMRLTGRPASGKALANGGFALEQLIWAGDHKSHRWVSLEFSQQQRLLKKSPRRPTMQ